MSESLTNEQTAPVPVENEDLGFGGADIVHQGSVSHNSVSSFVPSLIDVAVNSFCEKYVVEKQQVYLGFILVCTLIVALLAIALAWSHFSGIILNFSAAEERTRKASEKEKKKDD